MFSMNCMKNINRLNTEQQKIFLKRILLIHPLEDENRQKIAVEGKTYVCNTHAINKVVNTIEKYYR